MNNSQDIKSNINLCNQAWKRFTAFITICLEKWFIQEKSNIKKHIFVTLFFLVLLLSCKFMCHPSPPPLRLHSLLWLWNLGF